MAHKVDPKSSKELGRVKAPHDTTIQALKRAEDHIQHIADQRGVEYNVAIPKRAGEKHSLVAYICTRGEKVEILHTVQAHFANGNMKAEGAEDLSLEGTARFATKQEAKRAFLKQERTTDVVLDFAPWLEDEGNEMAAAAGRSLPYPDAKEPGPDNGEVFYHEAWLKQREREKTPEWIAAFRSTGPRPTRCPCLPCLERRRHCDCRQCEAWRATAEGIAALAEGIAALDNETQAPPAALPIDGAVPLELQQLFVLPSEGNAALQSYVEPGDDPEMMQPEYANLLEANKNPQKRAFPEAATPRVVARKLTESSAPKLRAPVRPPPDTLMRPAMPIGTALPSAGIAAIGCVELHLDAVLGAQQRPSYAQGMRHKPLCEDLTGIAYPRGRCPSFRTDLLRRNPMSDPFTGETPMVQGAKSGPYHHDAGCRNSKNRKRPRDSTPPPPPQPLTHPPRFCQDLDVGWFKLQSNASQSFVVALGKARIGSSLSLLPSPAPLLFSRFG